MKRFGQLIGLRPERLEEKAAPEPPAKPAEAKPEPKAEPGKV